MHNGRIEKKRNTWNITEDATYYKDKGNQQREDGNQ